MASISRQPNGRRVIQFTGLNHVRHSVRLGKVNQKQAEKIKAHIEHLLAAKLSGHALDNETAKWIGDLDDALADKLVRVDLIPKRKNAERDQTKLEAILKSYLDSRNDLKPATKIVRGLVIQDLTAFFGENCNVQSISAGEADDFKQWLIGRGLASSTIHKRLQVARSFFHAMKRRKLIDENPFDGVKAAAIGIKDRTRFISQEAISRVLEACPNHDWRTIVALSRYGGLRCPSEVLSLRWQDVDWEAARIIVQSPKTEHIAGKATRTIPVFAELRPYLEEAFELAPDGAEYVVDEKFRKAAEGANTWLNANLRTTFLKIVHRAGLEPWPRPFHNLRASRETELVESYPVQVVTDWLGNSPTVAMRHYLMTTDEHFQKAIDGSALRKAVQSGAAKPRQLLQSQKPVNTKTPCLQGVASSGDSWPDEKIAVEGFEPPTRGL